MNILHLKYAAEIARTGSLNKAADNLYMGQPNLSRAIRELETDLGITIFVRSSKGMVVTPEGAVFLGYANKILSQIDEVEAIYRDGTAVRETFSISVPRASYIAEAFVQFSKTLDPSRPSELVYKETNAMRAIKNVLEADYKLGIIRYAASHDRQFTETLGQKGIHYELIGDFSYVLLMSRNHPLARKEEIHYPDLRHYTEVAHGDPYVPSLPLSVVRKEEFPDDIDKRIYVFDRSSQFELLEENTDTFMWVSAIPQKLIGRDDLIQKICPDNTKLYRDVLIYREDYTLTDLDRVFIRELYASRQKSL